MRSKAIFILVALLAYGFVAQASPVSEREARLAAQAFARSGERFGVRFGKTVEKTRFFALTNGASFISVKMDGGTIFLSGDSEDEPVVAMAPVDVSEPEAGSPLRALLEKDMAVRMRFRASRTASTPSSAALAARRRWQRLLRDGEAIDAADGDKVPSSTAAPTDLRVGALVKSKWSQSGSGENYYTPKNYVCGCVATAMAQIMRYWSFPVSEVPQFSNAGCRVDGNIAPQTAKGGVYEWDNMPFEPEAVYESIGKLTYDCGVSVAMDWGSSGSGAMTSDVGDALKNYFGYANAKVCQSTDLSTDESVRQRYVYAPIDAGMPVQLGINSNGQNGHSVVGDGYGYIDGVSYVHLNMGWAGQGDVWHHLPDITYVATMGGFEYEADTVHTCVYNISPLNSGVVLSGRTLDDEGVPVPNATIKVFKSGTAELVTTVTGNANGVYGVMLPPDAEYELVASADGLEGEAVFHLLSENSWGNDFELGTPSVRVITPDMSVTNEYASLSKALKESAEIAGARLEIFAPAALRRSVVVTNDCIICSASDIAGPAAVRRSGGESPASITVDGATVVFSNVLFSTASTTPVFAVNGGVVAVSGVAAVSETLSIEASGGGTFAIAGAIDGGIQVFVENAMTNGAVFGVAMCDLATAAANAAKIINPGDCSLGGQAFLDSVSGNVLLRWAKVSVNPSAAIAWYVDGGGNTNYFRSVDEAMDSGATEVVIQRSATLTKVFQPANSVLIRSVNGAVLKAGPEAQISVGPGVTATFRDVEICEFDGADAFLVVDGGTVELGSGAVFANLVTRNSVRDGDNACCYGAIAVKSGSLVMLSGAVITGCRAESDYSNESGGYGGGVYVCGNAVFDMRGGAISNCYAEVEGGGVYAESQAKVRLSGDATISGNFASIMKDGSLAEDDLRRQTKTEVLVDGVLTGRIGIVDAAGTGNGDGVQFVKAGSASPAEMASSLAAFYCTAPLAESGTYRRAVVAGDGTITWKIEEVSTDPVSVEPLYDVGGHVTNAVARSISPDGTATNYWVTLSDAFRSISSDAEIELLDDAAFSEDIVVTNSVTLRTAGDSLVYPYSAIVSRTGDCRVSVLNGGALTVEYVDFCSANVSFDIDTWQYVAAGEICFFDVDGGFLRLDDAFVSDIYGRADRAAAAIVAYNGATVELDGGTMIEYCCNYFVSADSSNDGAAGGVVAEGSGTTLRLLGCSIKHCYANKTGGVFVGNKAEVHVSGNVRIEDNECDDINSGGSMVVAEGAKLYLDGELTGRVGCMEGVGGSSNVFGVVTNSAPGVAASATNFVHDVTHARGSVSGSDLVWDVEGRASVAIPVFPAQDFTYDGTTHVFAADGEGYTVENVIGVYAGSYVAYARLADGCIWEDGTSGVKSYAWSIAKAPLSVKANDAEKTVGEKEDPPLTYSVTGVVAWDSPKSVIDVVLGRMSGEEEGTYDIVLVRADVLDSNYSFNPETSFTPGVFTIKPADGDLLPELAPGSSLAAITNALVSSGVSDPRVFAAVEAYFAADPEGAVTLYNSFRTWAKGTSSGASAVCSSKKAWVSYEFGANSLFENDPTVVVTSMSIEDPSTASMRVTLVVKDGDADKTVNPESVAALFKMSTDLVTWSDDLTATVNPDGSYTVSPNDPTLTSAFITLKY